MMELPSTSPSRFELNLHILMNYPSQVVNW
jgi:hypothetical protein